LNLQQAAFATEPTPQDATLHLPTTAGALALLLSNKQIEAPIVSAVAVWQLCQIQYSP
jgi:hypothetical protein